MHYTLMTTGEVANLLQVAEITLRKWRLSGIGPQFVKAGANVRYRADDVAAWITARTVQSTSAPCPLSLRNGG
jgi:predicted site-specific integrase-resolvase